MKKILINCKYALVTVCFTSAKMMYNMQYAKMIYNMEIMECIIFLPWIQQNISQLKVGLSPSKKLCFICLNEIPLNMMENVFLFQLKALFVLKLCEFLS